jgi:hypothetical protein
MAILGIIPIATGIVGLFGLNDPIFANSGPPANAILDSNLGLARLGNCPFTR